MFKLFIFIFLFSALVKAGAPSDLVYFQEDGDKIIETSIFNTRGQINIRYFSGKVAAIESTRNEMSLTYIQAIDTENIIYIRVPYVLNSTLNYSYGPASSKNGSSETYNHKGIADASIGYVHNFILSSGVDKKSKLVLGLDLSPKLQTATGATTTEDGNSARGGHAVKVNISYATATERLQRLAGISYTFADKRTESNSTGDDETTGGHTTALSFGFQYATSLTYSLAGGISQSYISASDNVRTSGKNSTGAMTVTQLLLGLVAHRDDNRFSGALILGFSPTYDFSFDTSANKLETSVDGSRTIAASLAWKI